MMKISENIGNIISGLALAVSMYAVWVTSQFNSRQKKLMDTQEELNRLLLEKEHSGNTNEKKADLGASIVKIGSSNRRLRVWNKGKATARNIQIEFPEGNEFVMQSDLESKLPLESLEQHQSFELIAFGHMGMKPKHTIKLAWSDDFSDKNDKTIQIIL